MIIKGTEITLQYPQCSLFPKLIFTRLDKCECCGEYLSDEYVKIFNSVGDEELCRICRGCYYKDITGWQFYAVSNYKGDKQCLSCILSHTNLCKGKSNDGHKCENYKKN